MKISIRIVLTTLIVLFGSSALAAQGIVQIKETTFSVKTDRIGVVMTEIPKPDLHINFTCAICMATAYMANSGLTAHTQTLPVDGIAAIKNDIADFLRKKELDVKIIPEDFNISELPDFDKRGKNVAQKDFSSLQKKLDIDKIIVIQIENVGMTRNYVGYAPTQYPQAWIKGRAYMVNLNNNMYELYWPVTVIKGAEGKWDEPPKFPGLTNAYFQVIELLKEKLVNAMDGG